MSMRVLCLGGGSAALTLARRLGGSLTIVALDEHLAPESLFPEILTAGVHPRKHPSIVTGVVEKISLADKRVFVTRRSRERDELVELEYDQLVIGLDKLEQLDPDEPAIALDTVEACRRAHDHIRTMLDLAELGVSPIERRRLLSIVVAGPWSRAQPIAVELAAYLRRSTHRDHPRIRPDELSISIVSPDCPERAASDHHVAVFRAALASATAESAVLDDHTELPARTILRAGPSARWRAIAALPLARDVDGRFRSDRHGRADTQKDVWLAASAYGDVAETIAENLIRTASRRPLVDHVAPAIELASIGARRARGRVFGFSVEGAGAWWLWRAHQLLGVPGLAQKRGLLPGARMPDDQASHGVEWLIFPPGAVIVRQGELGDQLFVVRSGEVEVVDENETLAVLGPGQHFGEASVFYGVRRTATVRAKTTAQILALDRVQALALGYAFPSFGESIRKRPGSSK